LNHAAAHTVDRGTPMRMICVVSALLVVACGKGTTDGTASNDTPGPTATGSSPATVAVRLVGVRASGSVRVRVAALELAVDGNALPAQVEGGELDLGDDQSTGMVSAFTLPSNAQRVAITLRFQPEGIVVLNGKTQALDLSGPPLSLTADAAQLRLGNQVVLKVDLSRSLITQCGKVILMPELMASF
jgi:hypothetical protein